MCGTLEDPCACALTLDVFDAMRRRLSEFSLTLYPDKTRLIKVWLLEPYAIRRMVEESPPEMMKSLGQRIRRLLMDVGKSAKYPEALRAAREAIYEHIRNQQLVETLRHFEDRVHYMRIATLKTPDTREISYDGMMQPAEAIEVGDAENAQAFMRRQLTNALQAYLDIRTREEQNNWEHSQRRRGSAP